MRRNKKGSLFQSGREISSPQLEDIKETVGLFPALSRYELILTLCENLEWFTASGSYKIDACRKLLDGLQDEGLIQLPEKQACVKNQFRKPIELTSRTDPQTSIDCKLRELGIVKVEVVRNKETAVIWNEFVFRYHYLNHTPPFGTYLRYFIESERGLLGCLMFAGAAKALSARDKWIGWSENQRLRNLAWVINNSRFLIFPWVRVKNLASHVLGQTFRRIKKDWLERWGYGPVLLETFVDPQFYKGSCYKAANWEHLGMTTGKGLVRKGKQYITTPKMILVKPLVKEFRVLLCSDRLKGEWKNE